MIIKKIKFLAILLLIFYYDLISMDSSTYRVIHSPLKLISLATQSIIKNNVDIKGLNTDLKEYVNTKEITLKENTNITCMGLSPDEKYLACGIYGGDIKIWDLSLEEPTCILKLTEHEKSITSLIFSLDSNYLISCSLDGMIKKWDLSQEKVICILTYHIPTNFRTAVSITTDLSFAISCIGDQSVCVFNGNNRINSLDDTTVKLWDLSEKTPSCKLKLSFLDTVTLLKLSPSSKYIAMIVKYMDNEIVILNLKEKHLCYLKGHSSDVSNLIFTPDEKYLISGAKGEIKFWNLLTNECSLTLTGHDQAICSLALSCDGKYLASGSQCPMNFLPEKILKVWDLSKESEQCVLTSKTSCVKSIIFTKNSRYIISCSNYGEIQILDLWKQLQIQ